MGKRRLRRCETARSQALRCPDCCLGVSIHSPPASRRYLMPETDLLSSHLEKSTGIGRSLASSVREAWPALYATILGALRPFSPGGIFDLRTHLRGTGWLILATCAWGQAAKPPLRRRPRQLPRPVVAAHPGGAATIAPGAAVITIAGMCDKPPADKSKTADCKTVVTRAEFEQLVNTVAPNIDATGPKTTGDAVRNGPGHGPQSARDGVWTRGPGFRNS